MSLKLRMISFGESGQSRIIDSISYLLNSNASFEEIRGTIKGEDKLVNIFLDIVGFGKMYENLPRGSVGKAKKVAFDRFGPIFADHGFEMIKTAGDNLHHVCGLPGSTLITDSAMANAALASIIAALGEVEGVNSDLARLKLPKISIKISASIGPCEYLLDGYSDRFTFEVQGHFVNMCKRFEEAMNEDFYKQHGKNLALVGSGLIAAADNLSLSKFFRKKYTVEDKHGLKYECFLLNYLESTEDMEDNFLALIYGEFAHPLPLPMKPSFKSEGKEKMTTISTKKEEDELFKLAQETSIKISPPPGGKKKSTDETEIDDSKIDERLSSAS